MLYTSLESLLSDYEPERVAPDALLQLDLQATSAEDVGLVIVVAHCRPDHTRRSDLRGLEVFDFLLLTLRRRLPPTLLVGWYSPEQLQSVLAAQHERSPSEARWRFLARLASVRQETWFLQNVWRQWPGVELLPPAGLDPKSFNVPLLCHTITSGYLETWNHRIRHSFGSGEDTLGPAVSWLLGALQAGCMKEEQAFSLLSVLAARPSWVLSSDGSSWTPGSQRSG